MFVRKKKNKSGRISVQVIDKSTGTYRMLKSIGSSKDPDKIAELVAQARQWIEMYQGQLHFDFSQQKALTQEILDHVSQITTTGPQLLLGKIFDQIGFNELEDDLFKTLVIARLCYPVSKLKTSDYLSKYQAFDLDVQQIYRYLDKLYNSQKEKVQEISYQHTLRVLKGQMKVVFYDVTTLYFEIDQEDHLRKTGFSKEGKHQQPQILLGLLVSVGGYPLAYEIFEGNQFEGHTMLPVVERFRHKYHLDHLVIIADSGLLSRANIEALQAKGYAFILGARIKNEAQATKDKILSLSLQNGQSRVIIKENGLKLIISYAQARAKKDQANRQRGLAKLEKKIQSGKLTKAHINNRGYNKYLKLKGNIELRIDYEKFEKDAKWDGLKGYLTNTDLSKEEIIENYGHLWQIEKAFRISKHDLKIRPIYHRLKRRIEAHICIAFVAYKIYKELERQLKDKKADLSPEKAIEIAKTIYSIKVKIPKTEETITKTFYLNEEQKFLARIFDL